MNLKNTLAALSFIPLFCSAQELPPSYLSDIQAYEIIAKKHDDMLRSQESVLSNYQISVLDYAQYNYGSHFLSLVRTKKPRYVAPIATESLVLTPSIIFQEPEKTKPKMQSSHMVFIESASLEGTKIEWQTGFSKYKIQSSIDAQLLPAFLTVETGDTVFTYLIFNSNSHKTADVRNQGSISNYTIYLEPASMGIEDACPEEAVEVFHKYYDENYNRLKISAQREEALSKAEMRYKAQNKAKPTEKTFIYWSGRGSSN